MKTEAILLQLQTTQSLKQWVQLVLEATNNLYDSIHVHTFPTRFSSTPWKAV